MRAFHQIFERIEDPRRSNATRHDLQEKLMIALLCVISGGRTFEWFHGRRGEAVTLERVTGQHYVMTGPCRSAQWQASRQSSADPDLSDAI